MDFRPMRRSDRQMEDSQTGNFLRGHDWGILSVLGGDGYPYGVPVNYAYADGKIYIHSTSGKSHKLDAIREHGRVCFTVVGQHQLVEEEYTTNFSSVIVFGQARVIADEDEKRTAAVKLVHRLAPAAEERAIADCGLMKTMAMVEITPEHITGKIKK